jgi:hypothetical protein
MCVTGHQLNYPSPRPTPQIINSVDIAEIQAVYLSSARLDSDAVVAFVKALAAISQVCLRVLIGW